MSSTEPSSDRVLRRAISWLLALTVLFIFYASLYPFDFELSRLRAPAAESWLRFLAWRRPPRTDLIANLLFYLPFGVCVAYLSPRRWSPLRRSTCAMLCGAGLSLLIELLQFTTRNRDPALADFALNTLSSGLGAALALSARGLGMRPVMPQLRTQQPDPVALLLVALWLAFHAAPFMPTASFIAHLREPAVLADWSLSPAAIAGFFAGWTILGLALRHLLQPRSFWPMFLAIAAASLLARVVFRAQQLEINECLGLALALPLVIGYREATLRAAFWVGPALVFFMLAPFDFAATAPAFDWLAALPLAPRTAAGEPGALELSFLYVGFVWLVNEAGVGLRRAATALLPAAALIEVAQAFEPGKFASIVAPAAIAISLALLSLRPRGSRLT